MEGAAKVNKILKQILLTAKQVAEDTASKTIPGASIVIGGVEKLVDHDKTNNISALFEMESGIITALNSLKQEEIVNATLLNQGIMEMSSGFEKVRLALKK